jgi:hypothetical protein
MPAPANSGSETSKVHPSKTDCHQIGIGTQDVGNFSISTIYSLTA